VRPSGKSLRALAERLLRAQRPVIIAGHEIIRSDAFTEAVGCAEAPGAPVYDQTVLQERGTEPGLERVISRPIRSGPLSRRRRPTSEARSNWRLREGRLAFGKGRINFTEGFTEAGDSASVRLIEANSREPPP
jgi:benzoylformate decarboxylase